MNGRDIAGSPSMISGNDALELLQKMTECGYFDDKNLPSLCKNDKDEKNTFHNPVISCEEKVPKLIISSKKRCIYSKCAFLTELRRLLDANYGRITLKKVVAIFSIDFEDTKRIVSEVSTAQDIYLIGTEILTHAYIDLKCHDLYDVIKQCNMKTISEIATDWQLPLQFTSDTVVTRMEILEDIKTIQADDGTKFFITVDYEEIVLDKVKKLLQDAKEPVKVTAVGQEVQFGAAVAEIIKKIELLIERGNLNGTLHTGQNIFSALYTPSVHEQKQAQLMTTFFDSNGFITLLKASQTGISKKTLEKCLTQHNPQAILLNESIFHPDIIIIALQIDIDESIHSESFVDLSSHFPDGVPESDMRILVEEYVFPLMNEGAMSGSLIIEDGEVLFFSRGMIEQIQTNLIPAVIESYAKDQAKILMDATLEMTNQETHNETKANRKSCRAVKKSSKVKEGRRRFKSSNLEDTCNTIPISSVASAIADYYSDLSDIQDNFDQKKDSSIEPSWDNDCCGPLYCFCQIVIRNVQFERDCASAIRAEVDRLAATTIRNRKQGAAKFKSIEESFEESFKAACQFLQVLAKQTRYMINHPETDDDTATDLVEDWLSGCGADFARRITEYCLFKHDVEEKTFAFQKDGIDSADFCFYSEPDIGRLDFSRSFLHCPQSEDMKANDPLKVLRDRLPGSVGVGLAKLWSLTGGNNYHGGTRTGNFNLFLQHIEDSCLSICGIPFKMIDKKAEKGILFARRKSMQNALEKASSIQEIFRLSVALLYQKVKTLAACGSEIESSILQALVRDKKISEEISALFLECSQLIKHKSAAPEDLVEHIKACGLCKDITNYNVK